VVVGGGGGGGAFTRSDEYRKGKPERSIWIEWDRNREREGEREGGVVYLGGWGVKGKEEEEG